MPADHIFIRLQQVGSTPALLPSKSSLGSPGRGRTVPSGKNQWILRTFPWWRRACVSVNVSRSHWQPVWEYFQPLCSFLSVVGLSLPSLLFDQLCLFLSLSFSSLAKLPLQCSDNFPPAVGTTYFEKDVSLQTKKKKKILYYPNWFLLSSPWASSTAKEFLCPRC